jgi:uncharacterized protein (TIGR03000 family)
MSGRLLRSFALVALLVFGWSFFPQGAESQTIPYGPYGYSPGSYDNSYSTSSPSWSYRSPPNAYTTTIPYSRYGYSPGTYDYSSLSSPAPTRSYSYGYSSPSYSYPSYSYPSYGYSYSAPVVVRATTPAVPAQSYTYIDHRDGDNVGRLHVHVPASAKVWVDGEATKQKGSDRDFMTPPLRPEQEFTYTIKAQWNQDGRNMERTRQVRLRANDTASIDFTAPPKELEHTATK